MDVVRIFGSAQYRFAGSLLLLYSNNQQNDNTSQYDVSESDFLSLCFPLPSVMSTTLTIYAEENPTALSSGLGHNHVTVAAFLKYWALAVIMAAMSYGVCFTLFIASLNLLRQTTKGIRSKNYYWIITYIVFMFSLSTSSVVYGINAILEAISSSRVPANVHCEVGKNMDAVVLVLAVLGSDGFLVGGFTVFRGYI